jgi:uncharacterized protein YqhQ
MSDQPGPARDSAGHDHPQLAPDYYGGQAVIEGVMMRGADTWAVAVRQPDETIWVETHEVSDLPRRRPWLKKPMIRGVYTLVDSLSIGTKALGIAAERAYEPEEGEEEFGSGAMTASLLVALVAFIGIFILLPSAATKGIDALLPGEMGDGALFHLVESFVRIGIFLAYLFAISLLADIRRVFEYHGAEHMTIHAWEHDEVLTPENVAKYPPEHVRCGTNFLIMVMLLALVVYTVAGVLVPAPDGGGFLAAITYHVALRVVLLPVVAGLAYEGLKLGATRGDNPLVKALVAPGIWLQKITTSQPERDQIEVAIRSFEAVVPPEKLDGRMVELPSRLEGPAATVAVRDDEPAGDAVEPTGERGGTGEVTTGQA